MQESTGSTTQKLARRFFHLPCLAALLMLAATFLCLWPEVKGMATTSLWCDELASIKWYSAKGPSFTMTHYIPNNHIFFNLLNSVTPGHDRFNPLRARLWSVVFVALAFLIIIVSQALAGQLFEGSFQSFLFLANLSNLDLILQGRGYSVLAFAAVSCTVLTWDYFRRPAPTAVIGIALVVWLGTWSVPAFVFFGGALFLVLLIYTRDWRWLASGLFALSLSVLSYWPIRSAVLESSRTYAAQWGTQFATWTAISDIFSDYLCFGVSAWLTFLIVTLVTVAFLSGHIEKPAEKASLCLGLAMLLTFAVCLKLQTTPKRTMAFTVVPFGFIATTLLARLLRSVALRWQRLGIMFGIAITALVFAGHVQKTFHFVPKEAWLETARTIEGRFPKGTEVFAQNGSEWLSVYLSPDYPLTKQFDTTRFVAAKQIVVDSSFMLDRRPRFQIDQLPKGYGQTAVRQRREGKQIIYFWPTG
jgi:hypothetical protein